MTQQKFAGFFDHCERYAGECTGAEPPTVRGDNRGYALAYYHKSEEEMITVISNGVRFQKISAAVPQELACTLKSDQSEAARYLVDVTASLMIERSLTLDPGRVLDNEQPLLAGTDMHGLIAAPHPYFDEAFGSLYGEDGQLELTIVTLVPLTREEIDFADQRGADALYDLWQERETDLIDAERDCAI